MKGKKFDRGPFGDIKNFEKKSFTVPKKKQKGGPLVSSSFLGFVKKNEKGDSLVSSSFVSNVRKGKLKGGPFALT